MAELWRVFEGLKLSLALGYFKVEINVDSTMVVEAVERDGSMHIGYVAIFNQIKVLMNKLEGVTIAHSIRETNLCADDLTSVGCFIESEILIYNSPPSCISSFLAEDPCRVSSARLFPL
ncbi:uncharacterized protein LOC131657439 [Vicia villosa]|uniref:uncharacterized protein LOC131657439 n=1 Tax=Vicia villosa TaxID=3911 RepID=UPI00273BD973|nr:uncharacterized protein LOC131657439 [Vicia villosa]